MLHSKYGHDEQNEFIFHENKTDELAIKLREATLCQREAAIFAALDCLFQALFHSSFSFSDAEKLRFDLTGGSLILWYFAVKLENRIIFRNN